MLTLITKIKFEQMAYEAMFATDMHEEILGNSRGATIKGKGKHKPCPPHQGLEKSNKA
jgi:hypothetical protein